LVHKQKLANPLTSVTFTDNQWETDKWPVFVQVHRSHDVASIYDWQMFVKYTRHEEEAYDKDTTDSTDFSTGKPQTFHSRSSLHIILKVAL
jgi:hypothetical protein